VGGVTFPKVHRQSCPPHCIAPFEAAVTSINLSCTLFSAAFAVLRLPAGMKCTHLAEPGWLTRIDEYQPDV
jgi:hypothetical protein